MTRYVVLDMGGGYPSVVMRGGAHRCLLGRAAGTVLTFYDRAGQIQAVYDAAGNPLLAGGFGDMGAGRWSICSPPDASVCTPIKNPRGELEPGPVPAGTVFDTTTIHLGQTFAVRTAPWRGTVRATARPRLDGRPRVGAKVTALGTVGWGLGLGV